MIFLQYIIDSCDALLECFDDLFGYPIGTIILLLIIWGLAGFCFAQAIS
ncbi:MAG: hypothetical protein WBA39_26755 [Rivularia sp. (in: cyanobacteria)]